jgi:hypothetical protein
LKDCKVESDWNYNLYHNHPIEEGQYFIVEQSYKQPVFYPAYTWQEILWEYHKEFFGEDDWIATPQILEYLQKKQYKQADGWFRIHCILLPDYK